MAIVNHYDLGWARLARAVSCLGAGQMGSILFMLMFVLTGVANAAAAGSPPPSPWTRLLQTALTDVSRLRVRSGDTCHRNPAVEKVLVEMHEAAAIAGLIHQIAIDDRESGDECKCCGNPTLEFYRQEKLVASLSLHHGRILRWPGGRWRGDGQLTRESATFLTQWLAARGVPWPQREFEHGEFIKSTSPAARQHAQETWLKAMPSSLKPFWPGMQELNPCEPPGGGTDRYYALALEMPRQEERVRALLAWYGSGTGSWRTFPVYEAAAEDLLLRFETPVMVAALEGGELSPAQLEGAARLLAGVAFRRQRPQDLGLLPVAVKRRLLEHCLTSPDRDKRTRARQAFGEALEK
jgi:hypothetical protein